MSLSTNLVSQFAKITNDSGKRENKEKTVYGTVVVEDPGTEKEKKYVRIDGSDQLIPLTTTVATFEGDKVIVSLKGHRAIVTGNLTTPTTTVRHVEEVKTTITEELEADYAKIGSITAKDIKATDIETDTLTVYDKLTTHDAEIKGKLTAAAADVKYATIENLNGHIGKFNTLNSDYASFKETYTDSLVAMNADIYELDSDVAHINELMFGSATGEVMQTSFANAIVALIGNAQIKSAMIQSLTANKIISGSIDTNKVTVSSSDGSLVIFDNLIQIKDGTNVRVQIGKDASGNYSIVICDDTGATMFDMHGITKDAIKSAIIVNDMVADNANISASKLDIESLFEAINENGSTTIKSSKIKFDDKGQTLDVAFKELSDNVTSHGTAITAVQGKIEQKIWQQDINGKMPISSNLLRDSRLVEMFCNDNSQHPMTCIKTTEDGISFYRIRRSNIETYPTAVISLYSRIPKTSFDYKAMAGKQVTLSFKARTSHEWTGSFRCNSYGGSDPSLYLSKASEVFTTQWKTFHITIDNFQDLTNKEGIMWNPDVFTLTDEILPDFYLDIRDYKFEIGPIPTDWTPANDDLVDYLNTSSLEQIGGRNYVKDSGSERTFRGYYIFYPTVDAIRELENTDVTVSFYAKKSSDAHECRTFAYWYGENTSYSSFASARIGDLSTEYKRYSTVIPAGAPLSDVRSLVIHFNPWDDQVFAEGMIHIKNVKAEVGTRLTDWTPAPEDLESDVDELSTKYSLIEQDIDSITSTVAEHTAEITDTESRLTVTQSTVEQLADSISMLVTDANGASLMTQTENGWTFSTAELQNKVDNTSTALSDLLDQCGNTDAAVEVLQQAVADLGVISEYVKIGTYEDEPCIELGEGDSDFKLLVTNTRILFMDGSDVPAYITNKSLYIKKAVIEEELHQGNWVWKARSNGNLGLQWKGSD